MVVWSCHGPCSRWIPQRRQERAARATGGCSFGHEPRPNETCLLIEGENAPAVLGDSELSLRASILKSAAAAIASAAAIPRRLKNQKLFKGFGGKNLREEI
jgi:hypothetical protein